MDWFSTLLGAGIGFVSSVGIILVERLMDRSGKVKLYAKVVFDRMHGTMTWGFHKNSDGVFLDVPLWVEVYNPSNTARILRDINLVLYCGKSKVAEMVPINRYGENFLFANMGSYSIVAEPKSIKRYECYFVLKKDVEHSKNFDQIKVRFFDERDKEHEMLVGTVPGNWTVGEFESPKAWVALR